MLKNLSIGAKLGVGFWIILILLAFISSYSFVGLNTVQDMAISADSARRSETFMVEKEVDHLKWMASLSNLFLDDNVNDVTVRLDDHKCGLGKWLYGDATQQLASNDPVLSGLLDKMKAPHHRLHSSALKIDELFSTGDPQAQAKAKHVYDTETKSALVEVQGLLAERTVKATGEIGTMIASIQGETREAVQSMEGGKKYTDEGCTLAEQAGSGLTEIEALSRQVLDMIQQIATASEQQSVAAEQISKNVQHIASVTA